jgi:type VI secretion system protein ImpL
MTEFSRLFEPPLAEAQDRLAAHFGPGAALPPLLLAFGEAGAAGGLLPAALSDSPFPPPGPPPADRTVWWRWWLGEQAAIAEMAPALLADPQSVEAWDALEAALGLLARRRPARPVDGLLLVLSADGLAAHPERAGAAAARVRAIGAELALALDWQVPVHLAVVGLQAVPGHDAFFSALPAAAGGQPLGLRLEPGDAGRPDERVRAWMALLHRRLRQLRLGVLLAGPAEASRAEVFRFPEAVPALAPGLAAAAAAFAEQAAGTVLRGLYLTAPEAAAQHLDEVASRFLPADAGLAGPIGGARAAGRGGRR